MDIHIPKIHRIVVDIETEATCKQAAIISIGAAVLSPTLYLLDDYQVNIDSIDAWANGFKSDTLTKEWWEKQSDEAKKAKAYNKLPLRYALLDFKDWLSDYSEYEIYGNGSAFDIAILENAYETMCIPIPWTYKQVKCYRTLKNYFPHIEMNRNLTPHIAINDATMEAQHLAKILDYFNINTNLTSCGW